MHNIISEIFKEKKCRKRSENNFLTLNYFEFSLFKTQLESSNIYELQIIYIKSNRATSIFILGEWWGVY